MRLGPDQWPDYEARIGLTVHQYEITEADLGKRRRGDEYRAAAARGPEWEFDPIEKVIARAEEAPLSLRRAAERKAKKCYYAAARLVIYLNIGDHGCRTEQIEAAMAEATEPARRAFRQVWVLWKTRLYLLWDHAEREALVVTLPDESAEPQLPMDEVF